MEPRAVIDEAGPRAPSAASREEPYEELVWVPEETRVLRIAPGTFREMMRQGLSIRGVRLQAGLYRVTVPGHLEARPLTEPRPRKRPGAPRPERREAPREAHA